MHFYVALKEQIDKIYDRIPGQFGLEWNFQLTLFQPRGQGHLALPHSSWPWTPPRMGQAQIPDLESGRLF